MDTKKNIVAFSILGVVLLCITYILYMLLTPRGLDIFTVDAKSIDLKEEVRVEENEGDTIISRNGSDVAVEQESKLQEGDVVRVDEGGIATLYWADGSLTRLNGPSEIEITSLQTDDLNHQHIEITIAAGEVWTRMLNTIADDSYIQVSTASSIATIRGTEVYHFVSDTEEVVIPYHHGIELSLFNEQVGLFEGEAMLINPEEQEFDLVSVQKDRDIVATMRQLDREHIATLETNRKQTLEVLAQSMPKKKVMKQLEELDTNRLTQEQKVEVSQTALILLLDELAQLDAVDQEKRAELMIDLNRVLDAIEQYSADSEKTRTLLGQMQNMFFVDGLSGEYMVEGLQLLERQVRLVTQTGDRDTALRFLQKQLYIAYDLAALGEVDVAKQLVALFMAMPEGINVTREASDTFKRELLEKTLAGLSGEGVTEDVLILVRNRIEQPPKEAVDAIKDALEAKDLPLVQQLFDELSLTQKQELVESSAMLRDMLPDNDLVKSYLEKEQEREEEEAALAEEQAKLQEERSAQAEAEAEAKKKAEAEAKKKAELEAAKKAEQEAAAAAAKAAEAAAAANERPVYSGVHTAEAQ